MISNNTDVTDGWESVIFSRAKSVSNNFTLTCSESSSALWATLHACTCLTPTFAGVEHTPEHGLEKYKELHWLLLSACTAKFVVEQIALPQTVEFIALTRSLFCLKDFTCSLCGHWRRQYVTLSNEKLSWSSDYVYTDILQGTRADLLKGSESWLLIQPAVVWVSGWNLPEWTWTGSYNPIFISVTVEIDFQEDK